MYTLACAPCSQGPGVAVTEGTAISREAGTRAPGQPGPAPGSSPATFREVFAVTEFRALWLAQVLSVGGDQLARVALTLLVYARTHSALLAAVTFAASVVPTFVGGIALSGLADRFPRREIMVVCDLARALLVAVMAVPGVPLVILVVLLFLVTMMGAPFTSARAALYPDILAGDRYVVGTAVTLTTLQFAQVAGFAAGGVLVAFFHVPAALLTDAATFIVSGLITRLFVRARPAAHPGSGGTSGPRTGMLAGVRLVFANAGLRSPMLFGWLAAFLDVHEGVVAPLAASLGGGAVAAGMILAAGALGASLGAIGFSRLVEPSRRLRWMGPLAIAACATLILFARCPSLPWALAILMVSGVLSCFQLAANAAFVSAAPPNSRSRAFGIAQGGMSLGQGTAMILAGAAAQVLAPSAVIAASGVLGVVAAGMINLSRGRA